MFGEVAAAPEAAPGPAASPAASPAAATASHSIAAPHTAAAPAESAAAPHAAAGALPTALDWTLGSLLAASVLAAPTPALPLPQAAAVSRSWGVICRAAQRRGSRGQDSLRGAAKHACSVPGSRSAEETWPTPEPASIIR